MGGDISRPKWTSACIQFTITYTLNAHPSALLFGITEQCTRELRGAVPSPPRTASRPNFISDLNHQQTPAPTGEPKTALQIPALPT